VTPSVFWKGTISSMYCSTNKSALEMSFLGTYTTSNGRSGMSLSVKPLRMATRRFVLKT